ncbi:piggyBac transposable element-derived 3-like [Brachionus plicatilis]|uniref:PiggyBac transposable element-derived 3-like n=1 Tax=Brachionus plicatilis TaxID=10195 RepID=A0A3M7RU70_BRAPC|nr:piggyBac transposable element-derived 3-like [Brachionus plicatilis]
MDVVAKSAGGLGFLVLDAFVISYSTNVLEKRKKVDGEAEPVRSEPKLTPDDKKFCKLGFDGTVVTPKYRELTRECWTGFTDINESETTTSTLADINPNVTRDEVKRMPTDVNEKQINTLFKLKGNVYDGFTSRESTTNVYGTKERIMSKMRCYFSKSKRDACSTRVDATPQLSDFGIPRRKEINGPKVQSKRTEFRHESVHDHAVGRHIDLFDTLHRSEHSGLPYLNSINTVLSQKVTLFKWLKSGEKPDKCSKDGSNLYIYWCNFLDFRIFGKNVYRCNNKSELVFIFGTLSRPQTTSSGPSSNASPLKTKTGNLINVTPPLSQPTTPASASIKQKAPIITDFPDYGSDIENQSKDESQQSDIVESESSSDDIIIVPLQIIKESKKQRRINYADLDSPYNTPVDSKFLGEIPDYSQYTTQNDLPIEYFKIFFTDCMISFLTQATNIYSTEKRGNSCNCSIQEMEQYIVMLLHMGIVLMSDVTMYWNTYSQYSPIEKTMIKNREAMIENLPRNMHYKLFFDNWFSSELFIEKLTELGFECICTERMNRTDCKFSTDLKSFEKQERGSFDVKIHSNNRTIAIRW